MTPAAGARPQRRRIPLRDVTLPHVCPWPIRQRALSRSPYFAGLDEQVLESIDERMQATSWAEGESLFHAGDPAQALFIVAEGRIKLSAVTVNGTESITDVLVPGELFGAMSTIGSPVHQHTATAMVGSCALRIDQGAFREVLSEHPGIALRVLDDVATRLARAHADVGGQVDHTVAQRVATALLRLAAKAGTMQRDGSVLIEIPLSRADVAGLARSTPESVSRVMSAWRAQGIIDSGRRWTALRDRAALEQIAAG